MLFGNDALDNIKGLYLLFLLSLKDINLKKDVSTSKMYRCYLQ